jgi:hypothetical protein
MQSLDLRRFDMTLILGSIIGLACGRLLVNRWLGLVIVGLVWYVGLAWQTAYLAHPGRTGFFDIDGLRAVQGANWAQYWLSQIAIATLIAFLYAAGVRWRAHAARASRPGRRGTTGTAPRA